MRIERWKGRVVEMAMSGLRFDHEEDCPVVYFTDHTEGCECGAGNANDLLNEIARAMNGGGLDDDDGE